ncbi:MAG: DUF6510 family protein [Actinomycetota bacterium]
MESVDMRVDGNAIAGDLGEIFVHDMTSARIACGGCGRVEAIGAEHAYMRAPSIVLRCCHCDHVLLVLSRRHGRVLLAFGGAKWMDLGEEAAPAT